MSRVFNFSAGPGALPMPVLERVQRELLDCGAGASIMEISHRSIKFEQVLTHAEQGIKSLLGLSDDWHVMFLQGGATLQFGMAPMNLLHNNGHADYLLSGTWGKKALREAKLYGEIRVAASTESDVPDKASFTRVPEPAEMKLSPQARYVHITTNETIQGVQWPREPETKGVPIVADASSDILSRAIDASRYGLIYAGTQKNIGPAGVTLVLARHDFLHDLPSDVPTMLSYATHIKNRSLYNTPNTFGIYVVGLVCDWIMEQGGVAAMSARAGERAKLLYEVIDHSEFYRGHAERASRSQMNVTWRLPSEELEKQFASEATAQNMVELKGHRDVGGLRASLYNAMPLEGAQTLAQFMRDFERRNG